MRPRDLVWATGSVLVFVATGILAQVLVPVAEGLHVDSWQELLAHSFISPWIVLTWAALAGSSIAILRRLLFGRLPNLGPALLALAAGVCIDAGYDWALSAWALHRLVVFGPPVFQDGLLAAALAAFAALLAPPSGRLLPVFALVLADGWALSGLVPSNIFAPSDSVALQWLPAVGIVYLLAVTALVVRLLVREGTLAVRSA